jgi:hypothetical protein
MITESSMPPKCGVVEVNCVFAVLGAVKRSMPRKERKAGGIYC